MVRLTTSVLAVSLLAVPALAASSEQYERSVAESDLYGRDFNDVEDAVVAREELDEIFGREFVNDMEERGLFPFGAIFKGIKSIAKVGHKAHEAHEHAENFRNNRNNRHRREFDDEEFDLRDFDEDLEAREPGKFGAIFRVAKGLARKHGHHAQRLGEFIPQNNDQNQRREFDEEFDVRDFDDDLEAREPGKFGAIFRVAKGLAHRHGHHAERLGQFIPQNNQNNDQNQRREFDEEFDVRDFDEHLEAREPGKFGAVFRIAKGLARKHGHHAQRLGEFIPQNNDQNQRREFDEEFDLRDFDEDLEAREPGKFGAVFRIAKGLARKHGHHAQRLGEFIPQNNDQSQRREFDELEDVLEREYYDELD